MAVQPQAECKLHQRCHINGKGLTRFGSKFPQKTVASAASSSVVLVIDDDGVKRPASGTLIWPNVVLCAAHSLAKYSKAEIVSKVQIMVGYEYKSGTAPAGDYSQYSKQTSDWEQGTLLATQPQAKVVSVLEIGDGGDIDYALLAIEWTNTTKGWGEHIVTLPRNVDIPKPGTSMSAELLVVGHPWGANFMGQATQASVGTLVAQMAPHPETQAGTEYGYASFTALSGFSGGGVFNDKGQLVGVLHGARYVKSKPNQPTGPCFLDLGRAALVLSKTSKTSHKTDRIPQWLAGNGPLLSGDPNQKVVFKTAS